MLPTDLEIAKLEAMMNNAITANPQLVLYLDPFKVMRIAKENVALAELYFRQAQKRYYQFRQNQTQEASQMNAQSQQQSLAIKAQSGAMCIGILYKDNETRFLMHYDLKEYLDKSDWEKAEVFNWEILRSKWMQNIQTNF